MPNLVGDRSCPLQLWRTAVSSPAAVGLGRANGRVRGACGVVWRRKGEKGGPGGVAVDEDGRGTVGVLRRVHAASGMPDWRGRDVVRGDQGFSLAGAGRVGLSGVRHVYWT